MINNKIKSPVFEYIAKYLKKYGVKAELIDNKGNIFTLSNKNRKIFVSGYNFGLNYYLNSKIVNDKMLTKTILQKNNIPTPKGYIKKDYNEILRLIDNKLLNYPLVIKPIDGEQGKAVTIAIYKNKWLLKAIKEVRKFYINKTGKPNSFLAEEYISGNDYRFLVLDHKVLTVMRREPAYVIGNGKKSIIELITKYNSKPGIGKQKPLCPIIIDYEVERNLENQKLELNSIIPRGKKIILRKNANISTGGRSFECTKSVPNFYKNLAVKISKIFNLRFSGIDIIIPNINVPKDFSVIEINHCPGFDIHENPYKGNSFPVGKYLMKAAFGKHPNKY